MSVDPQRAGLRAAGSADSRNPPDPCQSILSALACALRGDRSLGIESPVSVDPQRAGLRALSEQEYNTDVIECQSILSALACALSTISLRS